MKKKGCSRPQIKTKPKLQTLPPVFKIVPTLYLRVFGLLQLWNWVKNLHIWIFGHKREVYRFTSASFLWLGFWIFIHLKSSLYSFSVILWAFLRCSFKYLTEMLQTRHSTIFITGSGSGSSPRLSFRIRSKYFSQLIPWTFFKWVWTVFLSYFITFPQILHSKGWDSVSQRPYFSL